MDEHSRVVLILGAGPNLGLAVASRFSDNGYKVALVARSLADGVSNEGFLTMSADLSDPQVVAKVFEKTIDKLGHPNIVIYNGADRQTTPPGDPLSASVETLEQSRRVGLDSAYVAAQEALKSFKALLERAPTAYIYTGNTLNQIAIPGVLPFALGKVAAAMFIEYAANAYGAKGYRFYYADERHADGRAVGLARDGSVHADMYWELANEVKQSKWLVTFTKETGRQDFEGVDFDGGTRASYDRKFGRS